MVRTPASNPVDFKKQHNVLEVSIPARETLEWQLVAVCLLHGLFAHTRDAVSCISFRPPVCFASMTKWVDIGEKLVRSSYSSHVVSGNRAASIAVMTLQLQKLDNT